MRIALVGLLQAAGARVTAAADAPAAIECLAISPVDLVLADFDLPGGSGIGVAEWVSAHAPALPVVLMSATLPESGTVFPASVRRFVRKPFDISALLALIRGAA